MKAFSANFVKGKARGRLLGFPTVNCDASKVPDDVAFGIYRCELTVNIHTFPGVAYYGKNVTFAESKRVFEIHLLRYHRVVASARGGFVRLFEKLRDMQKFENAEALKKQMARDILLAKSL